MATETKIVLVVLYFLDLFLALPAIVFFITIGNVSFAIATGIIIFLLFVGMFAIYREYVRKKK